MKFRNSIVDLAALILPFTLTYGPRGCEFMKKDAKSLQRILFWIGMVVLVLLAVIGELIWVLDPVRFGQGLYWIDVIDWLIYLIALAPLCWMLGALQKLVALRRKPLGSTGAKFVRGGRSSLIRSAVVVLVCAVAVIAIVIVPTRLTISAGSLGLALLVVFADMILSELERRKVPVRSIITVVVLFAIFAGMFWPTPYLVTYPGITINMNRYAHADGGNAHGSIAGVLVFERPAFPVDWVYARLFPHYTFERAENLGMSIGEYDEMVRVMKEDANTVGSAVAFHKAGIGKGVTAEGVRIVQVLKISPVAGVLEAGDIIIGVAGRPVASVQELAERMREVAPGQDAAVTLLRGAERLSVTAPTKPNADDPKRAAFGIQVSDELKYDLPRTVAFRRYLLHEGGPSHGAMLALALVDQLTKMGVTYGSQVAGTGTIEPDGSIGKIGGIEQKAYTVRRSGADVFFVPAGQEQDAKKGAPDLNIVPVKTLDDVLTWLKDHPKTGNS